MPANLENSKEVTGWGKVGFHSSPKERQCQKCSNYCIVALISHASKVMLKILQARLQQYMNHELPNVQAEFRKGRGTRAQIANICWIIEKAREFQKKKSMSALLTKVLDCVDHKKAEKLLEMEIPDQLTCLLRNLYACQESAVRTGHGKTDWFQIRKRVCQH